VLTGRTDSFAARDLEAVRDFTDVRDLARGYVELAEHGRPGRLYNLCSGRAVPVGEVLDGLLDAAGLDRSVVRVEDDAQAPGGPGSVPYQAGSPARVRDEIGWVPVRQLRESLRDLLAEAARDTSSDGRNGDTR
jgi:GDP-4-dehydro-6-deoxy-D-mannose reductase